LPWRTPTCLGYSHFGRVPFPLDDCSHAGCACFGSVLKARFPSSLVAAFLVLSSGLRRSRHLLRVGLRPWGQQGKGSTRVGQLGVRVLRVHGIRRPGTPAPRTARERALKCICAILATASHWYSAAARACLFVASGTSFQISLASDD